MTLLFEDFRRVGLVGKVVQDARHPVPDVVDRGFQVAVEIKLHRHFGNPVAADGIDGADALDPADGVFDDLGHAGFDNRCGRTGICCFDGDHRRVDIRVFPHRKSFETDEAAHYQQQAEDRRQYRASNGYIGKDHGATRDCGRLCQFRPR
jgi:hypothetical protein